MADLVSEETRDKTIDDIPGLHPWLLKQLKHLKIIKPTPIQYHCIPKALEGQDVIGAAKTGSGKTLAFVIPILQQLSIDPYGVFALVLTPTRELAFQIGDQFKVLGRPVSLKLSVLVGGMDRLGQCLGLQAQPHVVVATPGRLKDIVENTQDLALKKIKFLVLDEADRLMDGRFDDDLRVIWSALPEKRQTLLFSATITDRLQRMKDLASSKVFLWQTERDTQATVQHLDERYMLVSPIAKDAHMVTLLMQFIQKNPKGLVIVFTDTCKNTQILQMMLTSLRIDSTCIHSMIPQKRRLDALLKFKSSQIRILIATDLASRGLDIPLVQLVINHRIPNSPSTYIHRVGRTARAGRPGQSVTFLTPHEIKLLMAIEEKTKRKMTEVKVDETTVQKIMKQVNVTKRQQMLKLDRTDFDERKNIFKRKELILQGKDPDEVEREKRKYLERKRKREQQEYLKDIGERALKKKQRPQQHKTKQIPSKSKSSGKNKKGVKKKGTTGKDLSKQIDKVNSA